MKHPTWTRVVIGALIAGALAGARCDHNQTSPGVPVSVRGTLTAGVECPAMQGTDGKIYTLTGDLKGFKNGDEVCITGRTVEVSTCMQGITIAVENIKPASECR